MSTYLMDEIIRITVDAKSKNFWERAVDTLGEGPVEQELGELKYQMHKGTVKEPARYLTALLKRQMEKKFSQGKKSAFDPTQKLKTYFEETQLALFKNLDPIKPKGEVEEKARMDPPYSKVTIPWATFISSSFFTLSTNKAKSDTVPAKFRTQDGQVTTVPLTRGRVKPGGKEWGILTAEHGKVLSAIEQIWVQQGCQYNKYPNGALCCSCYVSVRELAKVLGWEKFGGRDLLWLTDMIYGLKVMPYYLDLRKLGFKGITGYGFSLVAKAELVDGKRHGQEETVIMVEFSTPLSVQLIHRRAVSRPKELALARSEMVFLIRMNIESILLSLDGQEYSKQLVDIIKELALPPAKWHKYESQRRNVFQKAVKELNDCKVVDGRKMVVRIEKGLFDWLLVARLEKVAVLEGEKC